MQGRSGDGGGLAEERFGSLVDEAFSSASSPRAGEGLGDECALMIFTSLAISDRGLRLLDVLADDVVEGILIEVINSHL